MERSCLKKRVMGEGSSDWGISRPCGTGQICFGPGSKLPGYFRKSLQDSGDGAAWVNPTRNVNGAFGTKNGHP
jgi:hypothetical protein